MTWDVITKLSLSVVIVIGAIWCTYSIYCYQTQIQDPTGQQYPLLDMNEYSLLKRNSFMGALGYTFLWQSKSGEILPSWIARGWTSWVIGDHIQRPAAKLSFSYNGVIDRATFYISKEDLESKRYIR